MLKYLIHEQQIFENHFRGAKMTDHQCKIDKLKKTIFKNSDIDDVIGTYIVSTERVVELEKTNKKLGQMLQSLGVKDESLTNSDIEALESRINYLEMANAGLMNVLQEIGNELLYVNDDGSWYAETDQSNYYRKLADTFNKLFKL